MSKGESVPGPTASIRTFPNIEPRQGAQRVDDDMLRILCCPITHQALRIADQAALSQASAKISRPIAEGLVREDGKMLYPIHDGIPLLIPEEGIPL
jgi:uncharacterized protein YbaR (Trm112 family)